MGAAMGLELHYTLSNLVKTILRDWPRTRLEGEGGRPMQVWTALR